MSINKNLPIAWVRTRLIEVAEINPKVSYVDVPNNLEVTFLPMKAIEERTGKIDLSIIKKYADVKKGYTSFINDDILFAKITPCMENGKIAIVSNLKNGIGFGSTEFHIIRASFLIDKKLLFFFLLQDDYRKAAQRSMTGTAGQLRVPVSFLENTVIPLPPLSEQRRIVAKIEELFTRLDDGVEALKKVKAEIKRYWQAVLKHAFEGRLTEEWRKIHENKLEPPSILLNRILKERRIKFEKEQPKKKYKEPSGPEIYELPEIPRGWIWTNLAQLAEAIPNAIKAGPFGSALKKEFYVPHGYKIYGQEQVIKGDPFFGDYYIDKDRYETLKSCKVKTGDILVSLVGTIGKTLILPEGIEEGIINPRLIKISLDKNIVNVRFIKAYFESYNVKYYFSLKSHGGTMDILNLALLKELPIPLPSLKEQEIIINKIELCLSIADEVDASVTQGIKQAERLRQSILKRAFEGKLVPQDQSDEPAEKLLERIKAEKAKLEMNNKAGKRRSRQKELR